MSNNFTKLGLLKNNCVVYFISAGALSIIEIHVVFKISLSNADANNQKFVVMMTSLPLTLK